MANKIRSGWGDDGWERGREEIVEGWGNVEDNNNNNKRNVTQWEHAGDLDNFVVVNNNSPQKGKGVCSSTSRGGRPRNGNSGWKRKREDFNNGNGFGGWKGKRAMNNENRGGGWKGKRAESNDNNGGGGGGWKRKRASSNEIGGKRASSNGNGGSQVSTGGIRVGRLQTLGNNHHGFNGHRVSLHFPLQSPHLQKILRDDFSLPGPAVGFQGQVYDPRPPPRQVNGPPPRQVNGPPPAPTPPLPTAVQLYERPVQERIVSRKVRVTHSQDGGWVMEVEEFR